MPVFCPTCSCPLTIGETACPVCGASFGGDSPLLPTTRPSGPVPTRPKGVAARPPFASAEDAGIEQSAGTMKWNRLYGVTMACVALACIVSLFKESVATLLALSVPGVTEERAAWIFSATLLSPMAQPAQPIPSMALHFLPARGTLVGYYALVALVLVQIALLIRRVVICVAERRIVPPPALSRVLATLLLVGLFSWFIPVLIELLLRLAALGAGRSVEGLALGAGVVSAFILPLIWIPAMNLIGPIFFFLETHSVLREKRASTRGNLVTR